MLIVISGGFCRRIPEKKKLWRNSQRSPQRCLEELMSWENHWWIFSKHAWKSGGILKFPLDFIKGSVNLQIIFLDTRCDTFLQFPGCFFCNAYVFFIEESRLKVPIVKKPWAIYFLSLFEKHVGVLLGVPIYYIFLTEIKKK